MGWMDGSYMMVVYEHVFMLAMDRCSTAGSWCVVSNLDGECPERRKMRKTGRHTDGTRPRRLGLGGVVNVGGHGMTWDAKLATSSAGQMGAEL